MLNKNSSIILQVKKNKEEVKLSLFKRFITFLVDSFNGMALGLFATLIIGVIFRQIGILLTEYTKFNLIGENIITIGNLLSQLMGVGIGVGMAFSLKLDGLKMVSAAIAGGIAALFVGSNGVPLNDPMVVYLAVVFVYITLKYALPRKTPVDILLIPFIAGLSAYAITFFIGLPIKKIMTMLGIFIQNATEYQPLISGIVIAVFMGMFLTMPISSAAIAIAINLGGIAGGAAVVGCSVQMLGFAVMSRKDNDIGSVVGIGLGTSMLQFKNIIKKPVIWLPTIIVSAILGALSTMIFKVQTNATGAGMGTSGLVGQIGTFSEMGYNLQTLQTILIIQIILPIVLVWLFDLVFRKIGIIKQGDLKL